MGTLDRRVGTSRLALPPIVHDSTLDILVENSGRVNFTKVIRGERKGITGSVTVAGHEPDRWQIFSLPMDHVAACIHSKAMRRAMFLSRASWMPILPRILF